jgi:hypothetical protein
MDPVLVLVEQQLAVILDLQMKIEAAQEREAGYVECFQHVLEYIDAAESREGSQPKFIAARASVLVDKLVAEDCHAALAKFMDELYDLVDDCREISGRLRGS